MHDIAYRHARATPQISAAALAALAERPWPGNIRQLQHEIERAFVFSDGNTIEPHDLSDLQEASAVPRIERAIHPVNDTLRSAISEVENSGIKDALTRFKGNKKKAAESLGISRSYLYKKLAVMKEFDTSESESAVLNITAKRRDRKVGARDKCQAR